MVAEVQAIDQHDADVEPVERHGEPRREAGACERDEAPRHGTLRDGPLGDRRRQGLEGPVVLARRDPDGDRFEGARVEGIARARVGEARQPEFVAADTPRAQAGQHDAAAAEHDLARGTATPIRLAVGVRHVPRATELRAVLLHHRLEHLLPRREAEAEARGLRVGEDVEQRQRHLHGGDRRSGRCTGPGSLDSFPS